MLDLNNPTLDDLMELMEQEAHRARSMPQKTTVYRELARIHDDELFGLFTQLIRLREVSTMIGNKSGLAVNITFHKGDEMNRRIIEMSTRNLV